MSSCCWLAPCYIFDLLGTIGVLKIIWQLGDGHVIHQLRERLDG